MGAGQSIYASAAGVSDLESKLRGTGDLTKLERAFNILSRSQPEPTESVDKHALLRVEKIQDLFGLSPLSVKNGGTNEGLEFLAHLGPSIFAEFYESKEGSVSWSQFLKGYHKCVSETGVGHLKTLFSVFFRAHRQTGGDQSERKGLEAKEEDKLDVGFLTGRQLREFFSLCWLFMCFARLPSNHSNNVDVVIPKIDFLLCSALSVCASKADGETSGEKSALETVLSVAEVSSWICTAIPGVTESLLRYVRAKLTTFPLRYKSLESKDGEVEDAHSRDKEQASTSKSAFVLQPGTAWAVGLALRDHAAAETLFQLSCGVAEAKELETPILLYRASVHGRGLNRFWTCVDGYRAPVLVLISAHVESPFVVGAIVASGFENKESCYGVSGSCLYSFEPMFCPYRTSGKDRYYVYSYKHTPGGIYRGQALVEGVGFGGSYGRERLWLDEGFATLTVRHHAVDKTYHAGGLVPGQSFSSVTAHIGDVEIWGLGGEKAEIEQAKYLKRENLFAEQRRKVDLASFGNWETSPEKMMMDMMSDPSAPRREER